MQEKHEVIKERLRFVRERMKAENVDIFVVFTDDYHMSSIRAHILQTGNTCPGLPALREHWQ